MATPAASGTVISYPIPPFQNEPINSDYYNPSRFIISAISLGVTTTVTTSIDHNYVVGQLCRLIVPSSFGTYQLNEAKGYVLSIPSSNQVLLDINSTGYDPYVASSATTVAQILAIGDANFGATNTGRTGNTTYIPGSFIDISPV